MIEKKKVPEIRFGEFNDNWISVKLGELGKVEMCKRIFKHQTFEKGEIPFFKIGTFGSIPDSYISRKLFEEFKSKYSYPVKGDILISASGSIGRTVEYTGEEEYFQDSNIVWFQHSGNLDNNFLRSFYTIVKWSGLEGSTIQRLYNKSILETPISFPSISEQTQIGNFFQNLDQLISLHQKKYDKLVILKKAMLEKMFPKPGAKVPEIRFKGFEGEWEEKKLGDIGSVAMNKRIYKFQTSVLGEIPFYKIGTFGGEADSYISKELFNEYKKKFPYPCLGDILISASGSIGRTVEYLGADEYFQDSNIVWLDHKGQINNLFLKQFYKIVKWHGLEGSTIKRLYNKNILETKIFIPSNEEQERLGNHFQNLDNLISLNQKQLEKLKNIKKACLEKMFV